MTSPRPPRDPLDDVAQRIELGRERRLRHRRILLGSRAIAFGTIVGAALVDSDLPGSILLSFAVFEQIGVELFLARNDEYAMQAVQRILAVSFLGAIVVLLGGAYVQWDRGDPPAVSTLLYFVAGVTMIADFFFSLASTRYEKADATA